MMEVRLKDPWKSAIKSDTSLTTGMSDGDWAYRCILKLRRLQRWPNKIFSCSVVSWRRVEYARSVVGSFGSDLCKQRSPKKGLLSPKNNVVGLKHGVQDDFDVHLDRERSKYGTVKVRKVFLKKWHVNCTFILHSSLVMLMWLKAQILGRIRRFLACECCCWVMSQSAVFERSWNCVLICTSLVWSTESLPAYFKLQTSWCHQLLQLTFSFNHKQQPGYLKWPKEYRNVITSS